MAKDIPYEAQFYAECEYKPFTRTKHKCLRCQECVYTQYKWCLENPELRKRIDTILKTLPSAIPTGEFNKDYVQ